MVNSLQPLVIGSMPDEQQRISEVLEAGVTAPQVLFWQYDQAAVIMGCSQRPDEGQMSRAARAGLPLLRRRSGGGAVLAGPWMLSVTVFIPPDHPVAKHNIIEIFSWLEQIWIDTLHVCGVPCKGVDQAMIDRSKVLSQQQNLKWACYAALSHGEVVSEDGRKLVGLAQIRKRKGVALVSGLHLYPSDWSLLSSVVVDNNQQGSALERLNSDAQSLSGRSAETLLPELIRTFAEHIPDDFIQKTD
ncbi:lipoate--protein ligase family protein [Amphritea sp.]|uniref:lipoate--protein ligase family protein n=1 Tax=Amphritea sp. TaxID=1872502 RepID=UPI003D114C83